MDFRSGMYRSESIRCVCVFFFLENTIFHIVKYDYNFFISEDANLSPNGTLFVIFCQKI